MDKYQLRAARAMLGLTLQQLSKEVDVSHEAINKIENGTVRNPRPKTVEVLVDFFERKGLEFGKQSSVGFRNKLIQEIQGEDCYVKLLDDVYHTLDTGEELLVACGDDKLSPPAVISAYRRIKEKGIRVRKVIEKDNTFIVGSLDEYRLLDKEYFHNCPILVYKNKFACAVTDVLKVVIIEDDALALALRGIFNLIWKSGAFPTESSAPKMLRF